MGMMRGLMIVAVVCAAVAPARAMTEEEERAKAHFLAGQSYYDQASYTDALREFNEAYRISKRPALLYNIARCYEGLDQYGDAVKMLERYLEEDPKTSDRPAIETRIRNLKERQAAAATRIKPRPPSEPGDVAQPPRPAPTPGQPQPPAVVPTPAPVAATAPQPAPAHRKRVWTWVVGSIGVASLAAALGTGISSQLIYHDLNSKCTNDKCDPAVVPNAQSQIDKGRNLATATDVLWPIGAVALATSIVLFVYEGRPAAKHARVAPFFGPSAGGLVVAHDF
jgi:tetratricopeptide (TPR) repeat protein